nr:hypothetical protein [Tanacetum cinerariifolium]
MEITVVTLVEEQMSPWKGHGYFYHLSFFIFVKGERRNIYWSSYLIWYYPTTILDIILYMTPPSIHIDTTPIPIVSPTIPPSPNYIPASPDYSPASDRESDPSEDPSSDHTPPLPAILPFLSSTDDSSNSDIPDTPPSPTHGILFTETTLSTQRSPTAYGPIHMMTTRKRVRPLPTHRLAVRHSVNYSSSNYFTSNDTIRDSSSSSSSETSSDSPLDDLSDFSSNHSLPAPSSGMRPSHHLCLLVLGIHCSSAAIINRPSHDFSSVSPSCKSSKSYATAVLLSSPISEALSSARVNLLPLPKGIRIPELAMDLKDSSTESSEPSRSRGTELEMDVDVVRSDGIDIDPEIQAEIDECIAYADALRDRGIDARVLVKDGEGAVEVTHETLRDLVQRFHDYTFEIPECTDMLERIKELERVNMRLRDMMDVASQRVTRSQRRKLRVQRELRQAGVLGACDAARNLEPLMGNKGNGNEGNGNGGNGNGGNGNEGNGNRGNVNGGNGNGNGNRGGNDYNFKGFMSAREYTYQDFLKCQPRNFNGMEGFVG